VIRIEIKYLPERGRDHLTEAVVNINRVERKTHPVVDVSRTSLNQSFRQFVDYIPTVFLVAPANQVNQAFLLKVPFSFEVPNVEPLSQFGFVKRQCFDNLGLDLRGALIRLSIRIGSGQRVSIYWFHFFKPRFSSPSRPINTPKPDKPEAAFSKSFF
jgi:hypothetical protein